ISHLMEFTATASARAPSTRLSTAVSIRSLSTVPVPCALTKSRSSTPVSPATSAARIAASSPPARALEPPALGVGRGDVRGVAGAAVTEQPAEAWAARVALAGQQHQAGGLAQEQPGPTPVEGSHAVAGERAERIEA